MIEEISPIIISMINQKNALFEEIQVIGKLLDNVYINSTDIEFA